MKVPGPRSTPLTNPAAEARAIQAEQAAQYMRQAQEYYTNARIAHQKNMYPEAVVTAQMGQLALSLATEFRRDSHGD